MTLKGITLAEAPKSSIQLHKMIFFIYKENKNGSCLPFLLSLYMFCKITRGSSSSFTKLKTFTTFPFWGSSLTISKRGTYTFTLPKIFVKSTSIATLKFWGFGLGMFLGFVGNISFFWMVILELVLA